MWRLENNKHKIIYLYSCESEPNYKIALTYDGEIQYLLDILNYYINLWKTKKEILLNENIFYYNILYKKINKTYHIIFNFYSD